mgnify:CR=1 FL=1
MLMFLSHQAAAAAGRRPQLRAPLTVLFLVASLAILAGCASVGPDYRPPQPQVPQSWSAKPDPALVPDPVQVREWWTVFNDPLLTRYLSLIHI